MSTTDQDSSTERHTCSSFCIGVVGTVRVNRLNGENDDDDDDDENDDDDDEYDEEVSPPPSTII